MSPVDEPQGPDRDKHSRLMFEAGVTACLQSWSALRTAVESDWGGSTDRESSFKAEELRRQILDLFPTAAANGGSLQPSQRRVKITCEELADELAMFMEDEFSTILEDKSDEQVAETIFQLHEQCCIRQNSDLSQHLITVAMHSLQQHSPAQVHSAEHDDSDSDDDVMDETHGASTSSALNTREALPQTQVNAAKTPSGPFSYSTSFNLQDYISQPLFGSKQQSQPRPVTQEPRLRQLGEQEPNGGGTFTDADAMAVDEDGFATISSRKKGRKPM
jgi:pre-rRNA-processing protein TSR2